MITVSLCQDRNGEIVSFRFNGHAEYAEEGEDIVCAAVSILAINTINCIEEFTEDKFLQGEDAESGYVYFEFTDTVSSESKLLVQAMVFGLKTIEKSYGNDYIHIQYEEV